MQALTLGPAGTYSHQAANAVADEVAFTDSIPSIVEAVRNGEYDRGVIPVENSIDGSVSDSLRALEDNSITVVKELVMPIRQALMAQGEDFERILTRPKALGQCREFLDAEYPDVTREGAASTAVGVETAREDPSVAAIAHPDNAGEGLHVIANDIQDVGSNVTRFLVIAPEAVESIAGGKTSLIIAPNLDRPGLLLDLLKPFAERDINLSRLESRPTGERLGDYLFHVDIQAGLYEERTKAAVEEIEALIDEGTVRTLGSYDTEHVL